MQATTRWRDDPRPPGPAVVVDLDGVLSDASARQHHLEGPAGRRDWRAFFAACGSDPLLPGARALLALLPADVTIVLLSARPGWVFERTLDWLARHDVPWHLLVLRGDGPMARAAAFKSEVVASLAAAGFDIRLALDDDPTVVEAYGGAGIPAMQISSGYYGADPSR